MGYVDDVRREKDSLIRGATLIIGGIAFILAGTLIGLAGAKWAQVLAGLLAFGGITAIVLAASVYILPPLLPAR